MEAYSQTKVIIFLDLDLLAIDLASAANDIIMYLSYAMAVIEEIDPRPPKVAKVPDMRQPRIICIILTIWVCWQHITDKCNRLKSYYQNNINGNITWKVIFSLIWVKECKDFVLWERCDMIIEILCTRMYLIKYQLSIFFLDFKDLIKRRTILTSISELPSLDKTGVEEYGLAGHHHDSIHHCQVQ